jgi:hypothetical protein
MFSGVDAVHTASRSPAARRADEGFHAVDQCQPRRRDLAVDRFLLVGHRAALGFGAARVHLGQDLGVRAAGRGLEERARVNALAAPRMPLDPGVVVVRHAVDQRAVEVEQEGLQPRLPA